MCVVSNSTVLISVSEVRFHPAAPEHLFSCGLDGQLLHWDASASARPTQMTSYKGTREQPGEATMFSENLSPGYSLFVHGTDLTVSTIIISNITTYHIESTVQ